MNNTPQSKQLMIYYLFILFTCNLSCAPQSNPEIKSIPFDTNTSKRNPSVIDTIPKLSFTSSRSILHDSNGDFWFGSHNEGVCLFDGKSYKYFTTEDGLSGNQIRSIQKGIHGKIWFGTDRGVSSYHNGIFINHNLPENAFSLNEPTLESHWTLTENDLWFNAGNSTGVFRYNGLGVSFLEFPVQVENKTFNDYGNTGISRNKGGKLWLAAYAAVFGYDGEQFEIIDDQSLNYLLESEKLHIRSILEDRQGNLWIGNNGIGVLLKTGDSIINFSKQQGLVHFLSRGGGDTSPPGTLEHVFAIHEDRHGNIWFGDRDTGAWKYDGKSMTNYTVDPSLPSQMIWDIYEDRDQNLLFSMAEGGVYIFDGESFTRKY